MAELKNIKGVDGRIAATRRRMTALALVRAFWPLFLLVFVFVGAAILGVWESAPRQIGALSTLIFLIGSVILFLRGWRRYVHPSRIEAQDALDRQSELRPLASITDRPADPNPQSQPLWRAHEGRLAREAQRLRPPSFAQSWRKADPYMLRLALPIVLAALLVGNWTTASSRLAGALSPDYGSLLGADNMQIEAWVTPPAYSGRAPIFVSNQSGTLLVPAGSEVTIRAQSRSAPKLEVRAEGEQSRTKFLPTPDGAFEAKSTLTANSRVAVRWWGERKAWTINVEPDEPPTAQFVANPTLGTSDETLFSWRASDDYGIERAELSFRLKEPHPAAPDDEARVAVPIPGVLPRKIGEDPDPDDEVDEGEAAMLDLTRHKWAGLEVTACIIATDGAGQESDCDASDAHTFVLPDKLFLQPLAQATQEARVTVLREPRAYSANEFNPAHLQTGAVVEDAINQLENAPEDVQRAALMLDAITFEGPRYFNDYSIYLALRNARAILDTAPDKTEADTVDSILWSAALKAEYGSAADALAALLAAKKALEKALRDGASEEEIERLTQAFREAAENYVAAKLAEAIANGIPESQANMDGELGEGGQGFGSNSFADMLNTLEDLAETGASDQARQLLSDITNMLENLEFQQGNGSGGDGFPMPGGESGGEADDTPQEEQELSQMMERLSELLREQRQLNDDTMEQGRDGQPQSGGQQGGQPQNGGQDQSGPQGNSGEQTGEGSQQSEGERQGGGSPQSLADRQEALREMLEQLAEEAGRAGEDGGEGEGLAGILGELDQDTLDDVGRAQRRAEEALREGRQRFAERNQEQATRLLRDLTGEIAEALDELREARLGEPNQNAQQRTDPFGNPIGGVNDGNDVSVPDAAERQRAKDILEELRKRYGDAIEEDERDYLERLLDRF